MIVYFANRISVMLSFAFKLRRQITRGLTQGGIADVSKASRFIPLSASRIPRRPESNRRRFRRWDFGIEPAAKET